MSSRPSLLTAALVAVYSRLRRGELTPTAARREASGYFTGLRGIAATPDEERGRANARDRVEVCFLHIDHAGEELVRLTVDLRPWEEVEAEALSGTVTPEDVELLEVNATARARRGEIDEKTASSEAFVLRAIRYGLTLAPVSGVTTWTDYKKAVTEEDHRENAGTIFTNEPGDPDAPFSGPVLTIDHGGDPREPDGPPWPIRRGETVTGYFVPKGWRRPVGTELAALVERLLRLEGSVR